jgi:hypothetical protein
MYAGELHISIVDGCTGRLQAARGRPLKETNMDTVYAVSRKAIIDHEYLYKFFKVESLSHDRSLYGRGRPMFGPFRPR